jgi:predicted RND superfamily exporter protein
MRPVSSVDPHGFAAVAALLLGLGLLAAARRPELVVRLRFGVLAALALCSLGAAAALVRLDPPGLRLRIDASTEPLLPARDPARALYDESIRHFGADEIFVVAMECQDDVFRRDNLEALRRVSDGVARLEGVKSVQSLIDVYAFRYVPEDDWIEVRPFLEEIPEDPAELAKLRARALADPVYRRTLVSDDGRAAALNVAFRSMTDEQFIEADLDGRIAEILAQETAPGRRFHVAGRPHVKTQVFHQMLRDLRLLLPLAVLAMGLAAGLAFGSLRSVLLPLATALTGVLWTAAALALLDRPLTILTTLLGPTLVVMGCIYAVHVYARFEEDLAALGDPQAAARRSLVHLVRPIVVAGLTTAIGFAALLISDVPAVYELGAFAVFGVAAMTLIALAGVPATLAILPRPRRRAATPLAERLGAALDARLDVLARGSSRHPGAVIAIWGVLALAAIAAIPRIEIDTDYLSFFDEDAPVRRDFEAVNRSLAGAVPIYVPLAGAGAGAFRDPALLRRMEALQASLDAVPGVSRTVSFLDTLRLLNRAVEGDDPAAERIPDTREEVTELLYMVPKGELGRLMNVDHSRANLLVRTGQVGSAAMRDLVVRLEAVLASAGLPADVRAGITGNAILVNRGADGIAAGQPWTVGAAAASIFVLVAAMLGLRLGVLAMLPNLVPVLLFFGLLGWGVAPLSLPTSLIGSVALGITIDDTAHYLFRWRHERRGGADAAGAVHETTRRVGRAIAITSVMLCLGFGVVALSGFATLREFGLLSAATMAICVVADLTLLPALLARFGKAVA